MKKYWVTGHVPQFGTIGHVITTDNTKDARDQFLRAQPKAIKDTIGVKEMKI